VPKLIFIVDDSAVVRRLVRDYLESRLEYVVCSEAGDGLEAIQQARESRPDLVVLDFCMPKINGMEAAAALHKMFPRVPMILYTLHKDIVPEKLAKAAGIRAVVSKLDPFDILLGEVLNFVGVARAASA
jgi:DNA-binding NarL/FixJ family response regulator